jgi:uncharacterized protein
MIIDGRSALPGSFCWLDLAAADAERAQRFYADAFGWSFRTQHAHGGHFLRCRVGERDIAATMYRLRQAQLDRGVPSHWTPYLRVDDAETAAQRAVACGGRLVVRPFEVPDTARIALIEDAVGALVGLWQPMP